MEAALTDACARANMQPTEYTLLKVTSPEQVAAVPCHASIRHILV
jgi:hypothetical protein